MVIVVLVELGGLIRQFTVIAACFGSIPATTGSTLHRLSEAPSGHIRNPASCRPALMQQPGRVFLPDACPIWIPAADTSVRILLRDEEYLQRYFWNSSDSLLSRFC